MQLGPGVHLAYVAAQQNMESATVVKNRWNDECQRWWADAPTTSDPPSFLHVGLGLASTQIGRHRPKAADQVRRPSDTGCFDSCLGSPLSLRLVRGLVEEPRG